MQISSRFTVALHIFACVDTFKETHKLTSDFLSQSINVNPVIIRNILTQLKNAGLITVARGTGGVDTTRALSEISFYDVYLAIEPLEEGSGNIKQRKKRLEFYNKNGFETLDTRVVEMGVEFELMGAKGMEIKESDYKSLVKKFFDSFDRDKRVMSVKEMRDADSYTIKNFIDSKELMYRAGEAIFYVADWNIGDKVLILAGSGNNAGDGYVVADLLNIEGIDVEILLIKDKFSEDGKYYFNICNQKGIKYSVLDDGTDYNILLEKFNSYDYILDCIYGTGFVGEVREPVYSVIKAVNNSKAIVVSADINSGMNGDTGESNICINSDLTVSIGFLKKGLITDEAKKHIGKLVNMDIGIVAKEES